MELKVFIKSSRIQDFLGWETISVHFSRRDILFSLLHVWIISWCFFSVLMKNRKRKLIFVLVIAADSLIFLSDSFVINFLNKKLFLINFKKRSLMENCKIFSSKPLH